MSNSLSPDEILHPEAAGQVRVDLYVASTPGLLTPRNTVVIDLTVNRKPVDSFSPSELGGSQGLSIYLGTFPASQVVEVEGGMRFGALSRSTDISIGVYRNLNLRDRTLILNARAEPFEGNIFAGDITA